VQYDETLMGIAAKQVDDTIDWMSQNRLEITESVANEMNAAIGRVIRRTITLRTRIASGRRVKARPNGRVLLD
jgi:hypothetical protein